MAEPSRLRVLPSFQFAVAREHLTGGWSTPPHEIAHAAGISHYFENAMRMRAEIGCRTPSVFNSAGEIVEKTPAPFHVPVDEIPTIRLINIATILGMHHFFSSEDAPHVPTYEIDATHGHASEMVRDLADRAEALHRDHPSFVHEYAIPDLDMDKLEKRAARTPPTMHSFRHMSLGADNLFHGEFDVPALVAGGGYDSEFGPSVESVARTAVLLDLSEKERGTLLSSWISMLPAILVVGRKKQQRDINRKHIEAFSIFYDMHRINAAYIEIQNIAEKLNENAISVKERDLLKALMHHYVNELRPSDSTAESKAIRASAAKAGRYPAAPTGIPIASPADPSYRALNPHSLPWQVAQRAQLVMTSQQIANFMGELSQTTDDADVYNVVSELIYQDDRQHPAFFSERRAGALSIGWLQGTLVNPRALLVILPDAQTQKMKLSDQKAHVQALLDSLPIESLAGVAILSLTAQGAPDFQAIPNELLNAIRIIRNMLTPVDTPRLPVISLSGNVTSLHQHLVRTQVGRVNGALAPEAFSRGQDHPSLAPVFNFSLFIQHPKNQKSSTFDNANLRNFHVLSTDPDKRSQQLARAFQYAQWLTEISCQAAPMLTLAQIMNRALAQANFKAAVSDITLSDDFEKSLQFMHKVNSCVATGDIVLHLGAAAGNMQAAVLQLPHEPLRAPRMVPIRVVLNQPGTDLDFAASKRAFLNHELALSVVHATAEGTRQLATDMLHRIVPPEAELPTQIKDAPRPFIRRRRPHPASPSPTTAHGTPMLLNRHAVQLITSARAQADPEIPQLSGKPDFAGSFNRIYKIFLPVKADDAVFERPFILRSPWPNNGPYAELDPRTFTSEPALLSALTAHGISGLPQVYWENSKVPTTHLSAPPYVLEDYLDGVSLKTYLNGAPCPPWAMRSMARRLILEQTVPFSAVEHLTVEHFPRSEHHDSTAVLNHQIEQLAAKATLVINNWPDMARELKLPETRERIYRLHDAAWALPPCKTGYVQGDGHDGNWQVILNPNTGYELTDVDHDLASWNTHAYQIALMACRFSGPFLEWGTGQSANEAISRSGLGQFIAIMGEEGLDGDELETLKMHVPVQLMYARLLSSFTDPAQIARNMRRDPEFVAAMNTINGQRALEVVDMVDKARTLVDLAPTGAKPEKVFDHAERTARMMSGPFVPLNRPSIPNR